MRSNRTKEQVQAKNRKRNNAFQADTGRLADPFKFVPKGFPECICIQTSNIVSNFHASNRAGFTCSFFQYRFEIFWICDFIQESGWIVSGWNRTIVFAWACAGSRLDIVYLRPDGGCFCPWSGPTWGWKNCRQCDRRAGTVAWLKHISHIVRLVYQHFSEVLTSKHWQALRVSNRGRDTHLTLWFWKVHLQKPFVIKSIWNKFCTQRQ